jgi:hypothetical protein
VKSNTDRADPSLAKDLIDKDEPNCVKSNTERAAPIRMKLLSDSAAPK